MQRCWNHNGIFASSKKKEFYILGKLRNILLHFIYLSRGKSFIFNLTCSEDENMQNQWGNSTKKTEKIRFPRMVMCQNHYLDWERPSYS